ncbi:GIY-YIG nuclease family protein [Streptomyces albidoflavus]
MSHRPDNEPTALYRLYDANNALLYLGISYNPDVRWELHLIDKHWTHQVVRRTTEWYPTRSEALAAEAEATAKESPLHDSSWRKTANGDRPQWRNPEGRQKVIDALTSEIEQDQHWQGKVLMSGAVAKRFNVSRPTATSAMEELHRRGLLKYRHFGRFHVLRGPTKAEFEARFPKQPREQRELRRAYLIWTVEELREAIKDLPDDTLISARLATPPPERSEAPESGDAG